MPRPIRKRWIKLWTQETLYGTTSKELTLEEQAIWFKFLSLAGDSVQPGIICVAPDIPYTDEQLANIVGASPELLRTAKSKMEHYNKINQNQAGIHIVNWEVYQETRTEYMRDYMRKRRSSKPNGDQVNLTCKPNGKQVEEEGRERGGEEEEEEEEEGEEETGKETKWFPYNDKYKTYHWSRNNNLGYTLLSKRNPPKIGEDDIISEHHWIWVNEHGQVPDGLIIHHSNGMRDDNRIENLELLTRQDHIRVTKDQIRRRRKQKQVSPPEPKVKGFNELKNELNKLDNKKEKISFLINVFNLYHSNASPTDLENSGGRIAGILRSISYDYGYLLKLIWDSISVNISGSHLNYIQGMIRKGSNARGKGKIDTEKFVRGKYGHLVKR